MDFGAVLPFLATYTAGGVSLALKRLGVRRKRGRLSQWSPDTAYVTKLVWIAHALCRAAAHPERVAVVYADEVSVHRHPTLAQRWFPVGEEPRAALSHRSNTCWRISGAMDALTGAVTYTAASRMNRRQLCRFLRAVRERYREREVVLIWDNWPVHQHPDVLTCASDLRIHLLWLPTYAPWENPIEKLWRWLRQTVIHHHDKATQWDALKVACHAFLDQFRDGSLALRRYVGLLPD